MEIKGNISVGHHIITNDCRNTHGDLGAYDEASKRLRAQYEKSFPHWPKETKFRLVLIIDDGGSNG